MCIAFVLCFHDRYQLLERNRSKTEQNETKMPILELFSAPCAVRTPPVRPAPTWCHLRIHVSSPDLDVTVLCGSHTTCATRTGVIRRVILCSYKYPSLANHSNDPSLFSETVFLTFFT